MTYLPQFPVSSGAYARQKQWAAGNGLIQSDSAGVVNAKHAGAEGVLSQKQSVKGNGKAGGEQSLDAFTIDPARLSGNSYQAGNVNCGDLAMSSLLAGSTTPGSATALAKQSASLKGSGSFAQGNQLSAEAG